jgi:hypothetical protein
MLEIEGARGGGIPRRQGKGLKNDRILLRSGRTGETREASATN